MPTKGGQKKKISVGSKVILGRHKTISGFDNWDELMDKYVGKMAIVTMLTGSDDSGCRMAHVNIDRGHWFWRIRNMQLVE